MQQEIDRLNFPKDHYQLQLANIISNMYNGNTLYHN